MYLSSEKIKRKEKGKEKGKEKEQNKHKIIIYKNTLFPPFPTSLF
jgi:hypothetical protein